MGKLIEVNSTIQRIPESGHQVQLRAERKAIEQSGARRRAFTMLLLLLSLLLSLLLPLLFTFLSEAAIDTSAPCGDNQIEKGQTGYVKRTERCE